MRDRYLTIPCEYCGAGSGVICISQPSGRKYHWSHAARIQPIHAAWSEGYQRGRESLIENPTLYQIELDRYREERKANG